MQDLDRFRRPRQLLLLEPEPILPSWEELPNDVHQKVTFLLTKMFQDHHARLFCLEKKGGEADE